MEARTAPQSVALVRHRHGEASALTQVTVTADRTADSITFRFVARGDMARVALPAAGEFERANELWKHTCFEAFVEDSTGYLEFNFSPSGQWSAYRFDSYREGMRDTEGDPVLAVTCERGERTLVLQAVIRDPGSDVSGVGLSAVEEDVHGRTSYWALDHGDKGPPDFHNPDTFCFALPDSEPA